MRAPLPGGMFRILRVPLAIFTLLVHTPSIHERIRTVP